MQILTAPQIGLNSQRQTKRNTGRTLSVHNTHGRLTAFGFNCGYQQSETHENGNSKRLYLECRTYYVEWWRDSIPYSAAFEVNGAGLVEARKYYKNINLE